MIKRTGLLLATLTLAACTTVPPTNIHQPMTARPVSRGEIYTANGGIFQASAVRPLFEDRHARYVGDTLTINIVENTAASTKSNTNASRATNLAASAGPIVGVPGKSFQGLQVTASDSNTLAGKGDAAATNVFSGAITVTVIEVLPNGNLLVSGEKQVSIGEGQEYIRLSGVINPLFLSAANDISSSQVADARIEYKQRGVISEAQVMGWLARFFLNVLPF
ncbi:flagellar basal body L-ring protein FlgH [Rhodocyclus tenuis]|uniref:Flagellar L-ring protein n=2 Tax=Rhodocyclus TaxID=1064 RepID=A0A6L5JW61_RHOTE|nr:flagellar basal body L-ring protein FlgH [Rhodocyclus gracilis]MQY51603.1 flagellar biosynthesis protein FlgH [Rhodocyclus gracilis]MRD73085.1 flagellar biosynthesis protein FlgH [Rhodocyclus gracilis]NJA89137.1 flagellar basal body L-ring protein FlgH [Rhodocyclus gracilis]